MTTPEQHVVAIADKIEGRLGVDVALPVGDMLAELRADGVTLDTIEAAAVVIAGRIRRRQRRVALLLAAARAAAVAP